MGKHARKLKSHGTRDARTIVLLGLLSFAISILAWSATPGVLPGAPPGAAPGADA